MSDRHTAARKKRLGYGNLSKRHAIDGFEVNACGVPKMGVPRSTTDCYSREAKGNGLGQTGSNRK